MLPYIIIFSTVSIDGRLATKTGYSQLSCPFDKQRQHQLRAEVDAIVVGGNTVRVDNPSLTVKYAKKEKDPIRVVVSESLNLDPSYKVFSTPPITIVYTKSDKSPEEFVKRGVEVRRFSQLVDVFEDLYALGARKVMVEGGGRLIWSLVKEGLYHEIRVTVSPRVFGNGVSLAQGEGFNGEEAPKLKLVDFKLCECKNEVHLVYRRT
ncbi:MAG: 2,5-diamino-6-(ribosylamino)-4(3H)-pyrimidinone 5'-phosphate reductase [Candidatus Aramenus sulfurataquae]|uniref:2,5-diamino-6-(ribosylamino)-4(3H)-pyrimidinone 5'-phosphate reductase n=2 Tax=Candidatus Aramenus sulfurataquae TaxID=1326980 RepID=A0A0F2LKJ4_9CREN|nr:2,5-diamino-6-(ribosylamino)-4(3H)-pyrimidinone 5'-phosphate reductase [Candidatus Aramenus sulfurataquae]